MIKINSNYSKLKASYLFSEISSRVKQFQDENPNVEIIRMGIGDVTEPLPKSCIDALHRAIDEMADSKTFRGYGPEQGYDFLRNIIAKEDFQSRGCKIEGDEIFVSDGAKCDTANIQEIFANDIVIALPDPVYPVYVDTNVMAGRTGINIDGRYEKLVYLESTAENNFVPALPTQPVDLIYLCFPNNPTGATATKAQLEKWVKYARENKALILFDAAYVAFIRDDSLPQSIYEIEGADEVAIEFRSYSKTAGFTGTRCAYTVIPKKCFGYNEDGEKVSMHQMWTRRHCTKFNGVSYPIQRAAEAIYSDEGKKEVRDLIDFYLGNAAIIREKMLACGFECTGGINAPYIWVKTGGSSWDFFDRILKGAGVVTTPGAGFGNCGEGYIRISAFNSRENVEKAMEKITKLLQK